MRRPAVTFVLPGDGRSGGVRVTVMMANILRERGHDVRIVHRRERFSLRRFISRHAGPLLRKATAENGFLREFRGTVETFADLDDLSFQANDIVIAVGTYTVEQVRRMSKPVVKVRFNHGFPAQPDAAQEQAWRGRMLTITVSNTLVPRLHSLTEGSVWGVVPNGINTEEYFVEPLVPRNGIGALYSRHPNKAPEDLVAILRELHGRLPLVPQFVFGTEPCPPGLEHTTYTQLPPVSEARVIYNRCKVWIVASRTEGLPGVVLEAMACGCAVVSTDNDGSLEIIEHGGNGLISPRGDRSAVVEQVERCLRDHGLCQRISDGAAVTIQNFTWKRAADRMEEFLSAAPDFARALESGSPAGNSLDLHEQQ